MGHAIKVTWDNTVVKERREESYDNMLPVLSEFTQENFRHTKKKYRKNHLEATTSSEGGKHIGITIALQ